jgi:hypothetical protein
MSAGEHAEATVSAAIINHVASNEPAPPQFPTFAVPQPDAGMLRKSSLFESPQLMVDSPYQMQAQAQEEQPQQPPSVIQGAKRTPVTSFNLDPNMLGGYATAPAAAKPAKGGAVEF